MTTIFSKIKSYIVYLIGIFLVSSVLFGWISYAEDDLLWQLMEPSYYSQTTINMGKNSTTVWHEIFEWGYNIGIKVKKQVEYKNGVPVCKTDDETCPLECAVETSDNKKKCKNIRKYKWVEFDADREVPIIVKVTKLLLILVVALSVTMILYNGMMYIIKTWQWQEWKGLIKNIILILVGILISLFSVVIIRLIKSIPWTLDDELIHDNGNETDNEVLMQK